MLDVITLISTTTSQPWIEQCVRSVKLAKEHAGYPVNYIQAPGIPGHIGRAMARAMERCMGSHVAFVDDDDFVLPNAFSCLRQHFDKCVGTVCARELQLLANGTLLAPDRRHHLTAFQRDEIARVRLEDHPAFPNAALHKATPDAMHELSWVYVHRIRQSPASKLRAAASDLDRSANQ